MNTMRHFLLIPALFLLLTSCNTNPKQTNGSEPGQWIQLFNGQDLDDWIIKINKHELNENFNNTFLVRDGMMVINYKEYDQFDSEFGHIYYKEPFSHYKLRVEYRIVGEQVPGGPDWAFKNNGVMFHCQPPDQIGLNQPFPVSVEAQFYGGNGVEERPTGNLCTPSTHVYINDELVTQHCINSTSKTYHGEEWVKFELVVYGDSIIHHIVDGDTVMTYSRPHIGGDLPEGFPLAEGTPVTSGYIGLQAESHPFEFRKVELLDLSK